MKFMFGTFLAAVLGTVMFAQTPSGSEINKRRENQQDRVANGVASGQLTAGETTKLEKQEAGLNKEIHNDKTANGGNLTNNQKQQINQQQNKLSGEIDKDKHNAAQQKYGNNQIGQRRENQQARIAQGIRSGQLAPGETAKLENQQKNIGKTVATQRAANGGNLTNKQRAADNRKLNRASANIYNKKHNAAKAPK